MSSVPDLNGDGNSELVVGAPLEDDHSGAIYLFYSRHNGIQAKYNQVESKAVMGRHYINPQCYEFLILYIIVFSFYVFVY